jgi:hypothetical protein
LCNKKSHISIPIPVINAVNNPKTSGVCLFKSELQPINIIAIMISQLPTVSPTFIDSPTKSASKGEAPRSDCIVNEIPRDNIKIPNTKKIYFNLLDLFNIILCCKCNKNKVNSIYIIFIAFATK